MKKVILVTAVLVLVALGLMIVVSGCGNKPAAKVDNAPAAGAQVVQYTCPMHPEVISDKPGKCPKCGMDLVVKK